MASSTGRGAVASGSDGNTPYDDAGGNTTSGSSILPIARQTTI